MAEPSKPAEGSPTTIHKATASAGKPGAKVVAGAPKSITQKTADGKTVAAKPVTGKGPAPADVKGKAKDKKAAAESKKSSAAIEAIDHVANEALALKKNQRLLNTLTLQAIVLGVVATALIIAMPFYQTRYQYFAMTPEGNVTGLTPLFMPNMTDSTIEAWAANSATEILTIGFGDFDTRIMAQKHRFTAQGWEDFVRAFLDKKIGDTLKKNDLVLTSVPSEDPTIIKQGPNDKNVYEWSVQIPMIMTFATNNNVTKAQKTKVWLKIIRVPYDEENNGIAIDEWHQ